MFLMKLTLLFHIVTSQTIFWDVINTTYNDSNLKRNHIFYNYDRDSTDNTIINIPFGAYYLKKTKSSTDDIIVDKINGLSFTSYTPNVKNINKFYLNFHIIYVIKFFF